MKKSKTLSLLTLGVLCASSALAEITVGVSLSLTGPTAALGIPCKNALALWPETIAGEKLKVIVLDDATDPTRAAKNARSFVTEDKIDLIVGSATTPPSLAIAQVAEEAQVPQIVITPLDLPPGKGAWSFRIPQSNAQNALAIVEHMKKAGLKSLGFLGYSDSYGEALLKEIGVAANQAGIGLVAVERFARSDTTVIAQAIKLVAAKPDAVLVVASGSGAALPHKTLVERGFKGNIYHPASVASRDVIRVGGKDVEGALVVSGPVLIAEQLPSDNPVKPVALSFVERYEKLYGSGSRNAFSSFVFDAGLILQKIIPAALKKARPGTVEFRAALKEALESSGDIVGSSGIFNFTALDHFGRPQSSLYMLTIRNGDWALSGNR